MHPANGYQDKEALGCKNENINPKLLNPNTSRKI